MGRRLAGLILAQAIMVAAALMWAGAAEAAEMSSTVKYLSAEHVYLDRGSAQGLTVGLVGRVVRDGQAIGELEVVFVAERSASCTVSSPAGHLLHVDETNGGVGHVTTVRLSNVSAPCPKRSILSTALRGI